jgi:UDP-N-acetylmuramoylalanine--D-glutamate ligase
MRFSGLDGRRIGVWGAGAETRSFAVQAARLLPRARIAVVVLEEPADAPELTGGGAAVVDAAGALDALAGCDLVIRSPGVSIHRAELQALVARGVPVTTATGLWLAERAGAGVLGITGTKGKSTTATMAAHLLAAAGINAALAGNIGRPALDLVDEPGGDGMVVVELSSYQIADLPAGPETAMVVNLFREHVDWHGDEAGYRRDKLRLLGLPEVRRCVIGAGEGPVLDAARAGGAQRFAFGGPDGWHVTAGGDVALGEELRVSVDELPLPGAHNASNLCAALTALEALGVAAPPLPAALDGLVALPHRLQLVHRARGVSWIDDSISTTPESAIAALDSFPSGPVVLIGGGLDRGQDHRALAARLADREATVIGMPATGDRLVADARAAGVTEDRAMLVSDLPQAVAAAGVAARPGGVVLLSPAAPSYHAYRNYIARGEHFLALARALSAVTL